MLTWNRYGKSRVRLRQGPPRGRSRTRSWTSRSTCRARGRVRAGVHRRRQHVVPRDRHDEEHGLCVRAAGSDRSRRGVRVPPGGALRGEARRHARAHRGRRASLGAAVGGRPAASACVRAAGAEEWTTVVTRTRGQDVRRVRPARPRRAEDDRFGVRGLPARRYTTLPETRRSHARERRSPRPGSTRRASPASARATPSAARSWRPSPRTRASRCSTRCTRWAKRRWLRATGIAEITISLPNRHHLLVDLDAVRPRQPERGLRRHRSAVRPDRGDAVSRQAARRPARIRTNDRPRSSPSDRPVASTASALGDGAAVRSPRRKKFSSPCPVAASSKTLADRAWPAPAFSIEGLAAARTRRRGLRGRTQ